MRTAAEDIAPWPQWRVLCWESTHRGPGFYIRPVTLIPPEIYDYDKLKALVTEHPRTIVLTHRITSYNVCYTKLLRPSESASNVE